MKKRLMTLVHVRSAVALFSIAFLFASCSSDPDPAKGEFGAGVYVVNEGNFGSSNGSISFIDRETGTGYVNIFATANNGLILGDVLQSVNFDGEEGYAILNNSNKIVAFDATSFVAIAQITGLELPRYMAIQNGTGYVTEWVSFSGNGRLHVVNLATRALVKSYDVGALPEQVIIKNNRAFVTNSGANTVTMIDLAIDSVFAPITVGNNPNSIVEDASGKLWVLCGGDPGFVNPETAGGLYKINPTDLIVEESFPFASVTFHPDRLCVNGNNLFYKTNAGVFRFIIGGTVETTPVIQRPTYGVGVDPTNGDIYVGFAGDFSGAGRAVRYSSAFTPLDSVMAGIGPNGFVFK